MLDIALLTANASQLKYVLQVKLILSLVSCIKMSARQHICCFWLKIFKSGWRGAPVLHCSSHPHCHQYYLPGLQLKPFFFGILDGHQLKPFFFAILDGKISFIQVLAGILFLVLAGLNINDAKHHKSATILNNVAVAIIFIITVLNVIISTFGVHQSDVN